MDWKTIHGYAEEAELWTTLAINLWVIVTVCLVAFARRIGQEITFESIAAFGVNGLATVLGTAFSLACWWGVLQLAYYLNH